MKIKIFLSNNSCITFDTHKYVTVDAFAEDLASLKAFGRCSDSLSIVGDYIDLNSHYVHYNSIISFTDEVLLNE